MAGLAVHWDIGAHACTHHTITTGRYDDSIRDSRPPVPTMCNVNGQTLARLPSTTRIHWSHHSRLGPQLSILSYLRVLPPSASMRPSRPPAPVPWWNLGLRVVFSSQTNQAPLGAPIQAAGSLSTNRRLPTHSLSRAIVLLFYLPFISRYQNTVIFSRSKGH